MTKGRFALLLLGVLILGVVLSGCFLPSANKNPAPPEIKLVQPSVIAVAGSDFSLIFNVNSEAGLKEVEVDFATSVVKIPLKNLTDFSTSVSFMAPDVKTQTLFEATITAYDQNQKKDQKVVSVDVLPAQYSGPIIYGVGLDRSDGIYTYPNDSSVFVNVSIAQGQQAIKGVQAFVDGSPIPMATNTAKSATVKSNSTSSVEKNWVFFYNITKNNCGPHSYHVEFYTTNSGTIVTNPEKFYIMNPSTRDVEFSATPVENTKYLTGTITINGTLIDCTSKYAAFSIDSTPIKVFLNVVNGATKLNRNFSFTIPTTKYNDGAHRFTLKEVAVNGSTQTKVATYIIINSKPKLAVTYNGTTVSNGEELHVGNAPSSFSVLAEDPYFEKGEYSFGAATGILINGEVDVSATPLANNATATFEATVVNMANLSTSFHMVVLRDTAAPTFVATLTGYSTTTNVATKSLTFTVKATDVSGVKSVSAKFVGPTTASFPLTKESGDNWVLNMPVSKLSNGEYNVYVVAEDTLGNVSQPENVQPLGNNKLKISGQPLKIEWAKITGMATVNGIPFVATSTLNFEANVQGAAFATVTLVGPTVKEIPLSYQPSTGIWSASEPLSNFVNGKYSAVLKTMDVAGKVATSTFVPLGNSKVIVRTEAPQFSAKVYTVPSTAVNGYVASANIKVDVDTNSIYAVKEVNFLSGTTVVASESGVATSNYSYTITKTGTYSVEIVDIANYKTSTEPQNVMLDTSAPSSLEISATKVTLFTEKNYKVGISAYDNESGIKSMTLLYQASGESTWATISTLSYTAPTVGKASTSISWNVSALVDGTYTLKLIAEDGVGNTSFATITLLKNTHQAQILYVRFNNNGYYDCSSTDHMLVTVGTNGYESSFKAYVDGEPVATSSLTLSSVKGVFASNSATEAAKTYTFTWPFVDKNNNVIKKRLGINTFKMVLYMGNATMATATKTFYVDYTQEMEANLGEATPLYNGNYVKGNIEFTATVTDFVAKKVEFLINGMPASTDVYSVTPAFPTDTITRLENKVYKITVDTTKISSTTEPATFALKVVNMVGVSASGTRHYIILNSKPVIQVGHVAQSPITPIPSTLYVGNSGVFYVNVDAQYPLTMEATLGGTGFALTPGWNAIPVAIPDGATETFTAKVVNKAETSNSIAFVVERKIGGPQIGTPTLSGVTPSGVASGDIGVNVSIAGASSAAVVFDGHYYKFPLSYNSTTGTWQATITKGEIWDGKYNVSIVSTDVANNGTSKSASPSTVIIDTGTAPVSVEFTSQPTIPVNGFVKKGIVKITVPSTWQYDIHKLELLKGTAVASSMTNSTPTTKISTYTFTVTTPGTYSVRWTDWAGATDVSATHVYKMDTAGPIVNDVVPEVSTTAATFTVDATDGNGSGIASIQLFYQTLGATGANNGGWVSIPRISMTSTQATFALNKIALLKDGRYNLEVVLTDEVGNVASDTTYSFVVDNEKLSKSNVEFIFPPVWTNSTSTVVKIGATVNNESDVTITATSGDSSLINFTGASTTSTSYTAWPFTATWQATFLNNNATSLATVTVVDAANHTVTATKVIGFDNVKPNILLTTTSDASVAGAATFTVTVHATDNLSAIKTVKVGKVYATLKLTPTSTNEFGVTDGTYVATLTTKNETGWATYDIAVFDNAGNEATTSVAVFVDADAATITVKLVNAHGSQTISNGASETNYTSTPASFTWLITTDSGTIASVTGTITGPSEISTPIASPSGTITVSASGQYVITIVATNPINEKVETFVATKTIVVDNTSPIATLSVPSTLSLANFDTAVVTYTATDVNFKAATLTINGHSLPVGQASLSTPSTVALNNSVFKLASIDGATVTATLTVMDKALNVTTVATHFYVDTVTPTMSVNKTLYQSGGTYYLDIQFSEYMKDATITHLSATDVVFNVGGVYYYLDAHATQANTYTDDNGKGLLHISQLLTTSNATTNVLPLAGNTVTITLNPEKFTDSCGNQLTSNVVTVTFKNVSSPNPNNK